MAACADAGRTIPEAAPTATANIRLLSMFFIPGREFVKLEAATVSRMRGRGKWQDYTEVARYSKKKGSPWLPFFS